MVMKNRNKINKLGLGILLLCLTILVSCSKKENNPKQEPDYSKKLLNTEFDVWSLKQVQYYFQPEGGSKGWYDTDDDPIITHLKFLENNSLEYYDKTNGNKTGTYELKGKILSIRIVGLGDFTSLILQLDDSENLLLLEREIKNVTIDGKTGTQYIQTRYGRAV
jgi:hypothetical protein